jgi:2',3'-cyclic-nucleotide 2'-phosphodiesterase (5'-nucleotidase family)
MKLRTSLPAFALAALGLSVAATAQTRVQILHTSDLEGGVDAIDDAPNFAAVVEALEQLAGVRSVPSILLSAGDNYIPGPFFGAAGNSSLRSTFRTVLNNPAAREGEGRADITVMNLIGFDASAVGNHEFDAGVSAFADLVGTDIRNGTEARWLGAQFPYLSSNLDFANSSLSGLFTSQILESTAFESPLNDLVKAAAAPKFAPSTIVRRGNELFGIVGATTPIVESISSTGDVQVKNPGAGSNDMAKLAQVLQPTIDALIAQNVNKIILVTHLQQFALEQQLIGLLKGVDVIIAGGSDTILADSTDRLRVGDVAKGPYPFVTTNADNDPALIVSTDGQYSYVGRLVISFDAQGRVQPSSVQASESGVYATDTKGVTDLWGSTQAAFATGTKGGAVKVLTDAVQGVVIAADGNILGKSNVWLEGRRAFVRTQETNWGYLSAKANLAVAESFDNSVLVSHKNGGGIRNPIGNVDSVTGELGPNVANPLSGKKAGEISQLDIQNTLRFNNGLTLLTLTRAQLKEVLEHAVAGSGGTNTPGQYGHFAGITYSYDVSKPAGQRVDFACLTKSGVQEPVVVQGGMVMGTGSVRIVTLNFLADGGDSYPFPSFVTANPSFANRVDLVNANLGAGQSTFASAGSEQDAMAEFLLANYMSTPIMERDTAVELDQRQQQIGTRPTLVASLPSPATQRFSISGGSANTPFFFVFGTQTTSILADLGAPNTWGVNPILVVLMGATDANGDATIDAPSGVHALVQAMFLENLSAAKLETSTSNTVGF